MSYSDLVERIQRGEFDLPLETSPAALLDHQIETLQQYIVALERAKAQVPAKEMDPTAEIDRQSRFRRAIEGMFIQAATALPATKRDLLWNRAWVLGMQTGGLEHVLMLYTILLPLCLGTK